MSAALVDVATTVLRLDMHRNARPYINMVRGICSGDVDPATLAAIESLIECRNQGRDFVVIIKPNLVAAVRELLDHNSSPIGSGRVLDTPDASTRTVAGTPGGAERNRSAQTDNGGPPGS